MYLVKIVEDDFENLELFDTEQAARAAYDQFKPRRSNDGKYLYEVSSEVNEVGGRQVDRVDFDSNYEV